MGIKKGFSTKAIHTSLPQKDAYNSLHMPVYDGVSFEFDSAEDIEASFKGEVFAHAYSRTSNPTVEYFESKLLSITEAFGCIAMSSGMAAISNTLLSLVEKGANIVSSKHLFGHTYAFLSQTIQAFGIEVKFVDTQNVNEVKNAIDHKTRVLFFETITNPQLDIADISELTNLAHSKNVVVVTDSTITPPYVFSSKELGVDIEVMSATKFISGGAAAVGGAIIDNGLFDWNKIPALNGWVEKYKKKAFLSRVRKEIFRHLGGCMTAHTAHFLNLGLDVLALRVDKCVENCLVLGEYFQNKKEVKYVNYPGLRSCEGYELSKKQFSGKPGGIMTIDLDTQENCFKLLNKLQLVRRATNLNDNKSLIIHPWSTIYVEFSDEQKKEIKVRDTLLRISVGIEDVEDLINDFEQAFQYI